MSRTEAMLAGDTIQLTQTTRESLVVTNLSPTPVRVVRSLTEPTSEQRGEVLYGDQTLYFPSGSILWAVAIQDTVLFLESIVEASSQLVTASLPSGMLTSGPEGFQRLRVDDSQTGFFLGTQARIFYEFSVPSGQSVYFKAVLPIDIILFDVSLEVDSGGARLATIASPTYSGSWTTVPVYPKNTMSTRPTPFYTPQTQLSVGQAGASITGTQIDVVRVVTSGATSKVQSAGSGGYSERGVAAGNYGYVLSNIGQGTTTGVLSLWWEERP